MRNRKSEQREGSALSLSDALNEDVLAKLQAAKRELTKVEKEEELERQKQIRREREEREKNKSFEELLNEYGDSGSKY